MNICNLLLESKNVSVFSSFFCEEWLSELYFCQFSLKTVLSVDGGEVV